MKEDFGKVARASVRLGAICLLATLGANKVQAREHLGNGGFERGSAHGGPQGWAVNGAPGLGGSFVWLTDEARARSGQCCLMLANDVAGKAEMAMMSPAFQVKPVRYDVTAAVRGSGSFAVYLYQYDEKGRFLNKPTT